MAIQGALTDLNILELFQMLAQQEKVGDLEILYEKGKRVTVTFMRGEIIDLNFSDDSKSMIQFLLRKNVVRSFEIKEMLKKAKKQVRKVTTLLEEEGILTSVVKEQLVMLYFKEHLFEILELRSGTFIFKGRTISEDQLKAFDMVPISVDEILLEAVRQQDELGIIQQNMSIQSGVVSKTDKIPPKESLSKDQAEVYRLITEKNELEIIFANLWLLKFDALVAIYALYKKGYITVQRSLEQTGRTKESLRIDLSQWGRWLRIGILGTILLFVSAISLANLVNKLKPIHFTIIKPKVSTVNTQYNRVTYYRLKHQKEPSAKILKELLEK